MDNLHIIVIENKNINNLNKVTDYLIGENVEFCILFNGVYVIDVIPDLFKEFTDNINTLMGNKGVIFIAPVSIFEEQWRAFGISSPVLEKLSEFERESSRNHE
ncbi:hypothetical protein AVENLUH5627_02460 [Acinetobacter venetianus]|uniref:Uncharacterized protein n=1 Tax=Acinetobacter venetianus TaxID=52133 RepID=A0A150HM33_9GAMM|nr:hypothetical protein [Acinetobacter venetianus]KXZ66766.1 hypothetical protein AVENLUH5627_02460 [Acinetobacter venetianus]